MMETAIVAVQKIRKSVFGRFLLVLAVIVFPEFVGVFLFFVDRKLQRCN